MKSKSIIKIKSIKKKNRLTYKDSFKRLKNCLSWELADEEILSQKRYLGQYGKLRKIIINTDKPFGLGYNNYSYSAYITFSNPQEASVAILALDNLQYGQRTLKASYGMTKYCTYFLTNQNCFNNKCSYLHQISNDKYLYQSQNNTNQKKLVKISHEQILDYLIQQNIQKKYQKAVNYQLQDQNAFPCPQKILDKIFQFKQNFKIDNSIAFIKKKSKTKSKLKDQKKIVTNKPLKWDDDIPQNTDQQSLSQVNHNDILTEIELKKCQSTIQNQPIKNQEQKQRTKSLDKNNTNYKEISELQKILQKHEKEFTKLDKNILTILTKSYKKIERKQSRYQFVTNYKQQSQKDCQNIKNLIQNFLEPVDKLLKPIPQKKIKHDFHLFHQSYQFPKEFSLLKQLTYLRQLKNPLVLKGFLQLNCNTSTSQIKQFIYSKYFTCHYKIAQFFQRKLLQKIYLPLISTTIFKITSFQRFCQNIRSNFRVMLQIFQNSQSNFRLQEIKIK